MGLERSETMFQIMSVYEHSENRAIFVLFTKNRSCQRFLMALTKTSELTDTFRLFKEDLEIFSLWYLYNFEIE